MKLLKQEQIESLAKFKSEDYHTTSLYLDTDKSRRTKKEILLSFKNLLSSSRAQLERMDLSKKRKESLAQDLKKINRFFSQGLNSHNYAGTAIFSCHGQDFWQIFNLPDPPRSRIVLDKNPYVRTLSAILNEHNRICVLVIDRKGGKWYDIFMGEIHLIESLEGEVPSKVREGGWEGYESKRIERHIDNMLHDYFKMATKMTFDLFKKNDFDWLFLGCMEEYCREVEALLHPYLKKRLKGRLKTKPSDSMDKILKKAIELEKTLKKKDEEEILHRFISELKKGGLAAFGLKDTLRSLNRRKVQTLLITRNFSNSGRTCPKCDFLFVDEVRCPSCQIKTETVLDVLDEAVEAALDKKCLVKHINPPTTLRRYGNVGAILRYKA